tara:strand:- start:403 stop:768 length:366 start_codon:yes stop_codon:yes gene_type:complete
MSLNKIISTLNKNLLFFVSFIFLGVLIIILQSKIWFGDYSHKRLIMIKEDIVIQEDQNKELFEKNVYLEQEKKRLNSGIEAIEGLARSELGLIKPGEVFYQFKKDNEIRKINTLKEERLDE